MKKFFTYLAIFAILFPAKLFAVGSAGFENCSYSASSLGQANAVVARAEDPSTISFNPAGIIDLPGIQTEGSLETLNWRIFHRDRVTGDFNQNTDKLVFIPTFYTTLNPGKLLDDRFALGVGVNSPYGLSSHFDSIGMGRYTGYDNRLKMIATTIAGSTRLADWINVGGGAINYAVYDYGQVFNYPNAAVLSTPGLADGRAYTETSGNAWGWNFGVLIKPRPKHRIGISYRSGADVKVHGRVVIEDLISGNLQGFPTFPHFQTGVRSDIHLPYNWTFAYAYEPSKKWAAEFDLGYTGWESFADQDFDFDRPNAVLRSLGTIPRNYDNTFSFHLGGHYRLTKKFDTLGGFAFYQAAAPKRHVDNFLPDANRYLWTTGARYQFTERFRVDCTYFFMLFGSRQISNPGVLAKTGESIDGRYTSIINAIMLSFTYKFDFPFQSENILNNNDSFSDAK